MEVNDGSEYSQASSINSEWQADNKTANAFSEEQSADGDILNEAKVNRGKLLETMQTESEGTNATSEGKEDTQQAKVSEDFRDVTGETKEEISGDINDKDADIHSSLAHDNCIELKVESKTVISQTQSNGSVVGNDGSLSAQTYTDKCEEKIENLEYQTFGESAKTETNYSTQPSSQYTKCFGNTTNDGTDETCEPSKSFSSHYNQENKNDNDDLSPSQVSQEDTYKAIHETLETTVNKVQAMSPISEKEKHHTDNESPTESTSTSSWESEFDKTNGFEDDFPSHDSSIDDHNTENESFHSTSEIGQVAKEEMQTKHTNEDETLSISFTDSFSHQNHGAVTGNEYSDVTKENSERSALLTIEGISGNPPNNTAKQESLTIEEMVRPSTDENLQHQTDEVAIHLNGLSLSPQASLDDKHKASHGIFETTADKVRVVSTISENEQHDTEDDSTTERTKNDTSARRTKCIKTIEYKGDCPSRDGSTYDYYEENINVGNTSEIGAPGMVMSLGDIKTNKHDNTSVAKELKQIIQFLQRFKRKNHDNAFTNEDLPTEHTHINEKTTSITMLQHQTNAGENDSMNSYGEVISKDVKVIGIETRGKKGKNSKQSMLLKTYDNCGCPPNYTGNTEPLEIEVVKSDTDGNSQHQNNEKDEYSPSQVNLESAQSTGHGMFETTANRERAASTISENDQHDTENEWTTESTIKSTSSMASNFDITNEDERNCPARDGSIDDETIAQTLTEYYTYGSNQTEANGQDIENVFGDIRIAQQEAEVSVDEFNRNVDSLKRIDDEYSGNLKELNELRNEVPILRRNHNQAERLEGFKHVAKEKADDAEKLAQELESVRGQFQKQHGSLCECLLLIQSKNEELQKNQAITNTLREKLEETTATNAMLQDEVQRLEGFERFAKEKADAAEKLAQELESVQGQFQKQHGSLCECLLLIQSKNEELQKNQAITNTLREKLEETTATNAMLQDEVQRLEGSEHFAKEKADDAEKLAQELELKQQGRLCECLFLIQSKDQELQNNQTIINTLRAELERQASELTETQARLSYTTEQCTSQDLLIRDLRQRVLPAKDETIRQLDYLHRSANDNISHAINAYLEVLNENATQHKEHKKQAAEIKKLKTQLWYRRSSMLNLGNLEHQPRMNK
ncbi:hypothetical protein MAR_023230 [Mya arenaria]|uniref:Uncharacterized protein n=1 Tax=Mya arenaria TaxID=6604 RepID=A0ABY7DMF5_MYAAR|nr:hypothetical protein MAR_023230 [Mya arenaria]